VYHNDKWGTVCDNVWNLKDAQVVCNELGFGGAIDAKNSEYYGQGSGPIWLRNVRCYGNELTIGDCYHSGWGCSHSEDVGVNCYPPVGK